MNIEKRLSKKIQDNKVKKQQAYGTLQKCLIERIFSYGTIFNNFLICFCRKQEK